MDDPMTKEEIAAAREWSGLGDDVTDAQIVEWAKDTMWLATRRFDAALSKLGEEIAACVNEDTRRVKAKLVTICEKFKTKGVEK